LSKHVKTFEYCKGIIVEVKFGNIDAAIRTLSKKVKNEGIVQEWNKRQAYEKPSTRKKRELAEAKSRYKKYLNNKNSLD